MRVLSLCSGIGGLELALRGDVVAVAETDPEACMVLKRRFPDAEQLGDWTGLDDWDWAGADVVAAGLPCQPVSIAGQMARRRRHEMAVRRSGLADRAQQQPAEAGTGERGWDNEPLRGGGWPDS